VSKKKKKSGKPSEGSGTGNGQTKGEIPSKWSGKIGESKPSKRLMRKVSQLSKFWQSEK